MSNVQIIDVTLTEDLAAKKKWFDDVQVKYILCKYSLYDLQVR